VSSGFNLWRARKILDSTVPTGISSMAAISCVQPCRSCSGGRRGVVWQCGQRAIDHLAARERRVYRFLTARPVRRLGRVARREQRSIWPRRDWLVRTTLIATRCSQVRMCSPRKPRRLFHARTNTPAQDPPRRRVPTSARAKRIIAVWWRGSAVERLATAVNRRIDQRVDPLAPPSAQLGPPSRQLTLCPAEGLGPTRDKPAVVLSASARSAATRPRRSSKSGGGAKAGGRGGAGARGARGGGGAGGQRHSGSRCRAGSWQLAAGSWQLAAGSGRKCQVDRSKK
jgi:hypothetical protein